MKGRLQGDNWGGVKKHFVKKIQEGNYHSTLIIDEEEADDVVPDGHIGISFDGDGIVFPKRHVVEVGRELIRAGGGDILTKKVGDLTLAELFTYLDYSDDLTYTRRKREEELRSKVSEYMSQLGLLEKASRLGMTPQSFTSAADFHKWATAITGVFAHSSRPKKLVVLTVWVDPHE